VNTLCKIADVSRSGYYAWLGASQTRTEREEQDYEDYELINKIFVKKSRKAGWRTIKMDLENDHNTVMNHKKIRRIMNRFGLIAKVRRSKPYRKLMKATQEHKTAPNLLRRKFDEQVPQRVLLTDITYLYFAKGQKAYLSAVKDLASREILAYHVSNSLEMNLVYRTLDKLSDVIKDNPHPELMLHSDQGFHYTNPVFQHKLKQMQITQSMSRRGNCLDNAPMESFFGHMKDEISLKDITSLSELKSLISNYIYDYNFNRYQWTLKKMTPVQYRD